MPAIWPCTSEDTLGENLIAARSVVKSFPMLAVCQDTNKNGTVVRCVRKCLMLTAIWQETCERTLGKNLAVARCAKKILPCQQFDKTQTNTVKKILFVVRSVEKDLPIAVT